MTIKDLSFKELAGLIQFLRQQNPSRIGEIGLYSAAQKEIIGRLSQFDEYKQAVEDAITKSTKNIRENN